MNISVCGAKCLLIFWAATRLRHREGKQELCSSRPPRVLAVGTGRYASTLRASKPQQGKSWKKRPCFVSEISNKNFCQLSLHRRPIVTSLLIGLCSGGIRGHCAHWPNCQSVFPRKVGSPFLADVGASDVTIFGCDGLGEDEPVPFCALSASSLLSKIVLAQKRNHARKKREAVIFGMTGDLWYLLEEE